MATTQGGRVPAGRDEPERKQGSPVKSAFRTRLYPKNKGKANVEFHRGVRLRCARLKLSQWNMETEKNTSMKPGSKRGPAAWFKGQMMAAWTGRRQRDIAGFQAQRTGLGDWRWGQKGVPS